MKSRQEIINELSRLYRLQEEGKRVKSLINELENQLYESDYELDAEKTRKKDKKNRKEVKNG